MMTFGAVALALTTMDPVIAGVIGATIIAGLGGAAISAGGSILAADQAKPDDPDFPFFEPPDVGIASVNANADPVMALLAQDALLQLGLFDPSLLQQGGPAQQVISQASALLPDQVGSGGVSGAIQNAIELRKQGFDLTDNLILGNPAEGNAGDQDRELGRAINRTLQQLGFGGLNEFADAQIAFEESSAGQGAGLADLAERIRSGRISALEARSELQSNFPELFSGTTSDFELARLAELDREFGRARNDLLELANTQGFNPAAGLAILGEDEQRLRDSARIDSISRATALLGGQLGLLDASIGGPSSNALNVSSLRSGNLNTLGQLAAAQAASIRGTDVQTNALNQGSAFQAAGISAAQNQARAAGTASAFQAGADSISSIGELLLLRDILNQQNLDRGPGIGFDARETSVAQR